MKKLLKYWPIKLAGLLLIAAAFSMIAVAVGATMTEQTTNNSVQTRPETVQDVVEPETIENPSQQVEAVTEPQNASEPAEQKEPAKSVEPVETVPDRSEDPYRRVTREEYEEIERSGIEKLNNWDGNTTPKEGVFNF